VGSVVIDAGTGADGGNASDAGTDGGAPSPLSLSLSGPTDPVQTEVLFNVGADVHNSGPGSMSGLELVLLPDGLAVDGPTLAGGNPLPPGAAGYQLPPIGSGQSVQLTIPARVTALPTAVHALTVKVKSNGVVLASSTLTIPVADLPGLGTACGCGSGPGTALVLASLLLTNLFVLRRSRGAGRKLRRLAASPPKR